jgi:hypothetical protein
MWGECKSMGTSLYINNSLFISSLLSHFVEKKYISMGMWEHIKLGEIPLNNI